MKKYVVEAITINVNGQSIEAQGIDVMFVNYGTTTLIVNNVIRIPAPAIVGQFNFLSVAGNSDEMDMTKYTCKFSAVAGSDAILLRRVYKT